MALGPSVKQNIRVLITQPMMSCPIEWAGIWPSSQNSLDFKWPLTPTLLSSKAHVTPDFCDPQPPHPLIFFSQLHTVARQHHTRIHTSNKPQASPEPLHSATTSPTHENSQQYTQPQLQNHNHNPISTFFLSFFVLSLFYYKYCLVSPGFSLVIASFEDWYSCISYFIYPFSIPCLLQYPVWELPVMILYTTLYWSTCTQNILIQMFHFFYPISCSLKTTKLLPMITGTKMCTDLIKRLPRLDEPSSPIRILQCYIPPCDSPQALSYFSPKNTLKGFKEPLRQRETLEDASFPIEASQRDNLNQIQCKFEATLINSKISLALLLTGGKPQQLFTGFNGPANKWKPQNCKPVYCHTLGHPNQTKLQLGCYSVTYHHTQSNWNSEMCLIAQVSILQAIFHDIFCFNCLHQLRIPPVLALKNFIFIMAIQNRSAWKMDLMLNFCNLCLPDVFGKIQLNNFISIL
ncbi:hypothetical protein VP01_34g3 [Puccinia sorghi]|uniref:Uncharacterized protein n=1 Tax=Puccinia sorghi TaxID=27349 RepID=A0A0L6UVT6_9BASI|nr:hypothetical protein VP01_34g3 [Puccinia sorghi]